MSKNQFARWVQPTERNPEDDGDYVCRNEHGTYFIAFYNPFNDRWNTSGFYVGNWSVYEWLEEIDDIAMNTALQVTRNKGTNTQVE